MTFVDSEGIKSTDLAWAAGLVDGEGCIHIAGYQRGARRYLQLMLVMNNTDLRLLVRMRDLFGGTIGKPTIGKRNVRPYYHWQLVAGGAAETLSLLLPYLVGKRDQAEVAIMFRRTFTRGGAGNRISAEVAASRAAMASTLRVLKREVG